MTQLREGFSEIVEGWLTITDFDDVTERIERLAEWSKANGPLTHDEEKTVELMIQRQLAIAIQDGDFDFMGIDRHNLIEAISERYTDSK